MEEEGGGGPRLSKRFPDKFGGSSSSNTIGGGEVDYKTKAGTAWSHNFLNQKPWHPLSYPNQRRKWIAEQTHAQKQRRTEEVSREFAQEQEFFRQTALVSSKEKEKMEMMKAVSFMYVRPPGYNAESAKAAEIADEKRQQEQGIDAPDPIAAPPPVDKKKSRPKDVFGRALPTEEEFEVLKNAPRLETGAPARVKPFAVEIRNVRCVRCGTFGHQSGDRECPLKDAIMPNEESRLKRDDPLTAIMAQTDSGEPLKWELKQRPGMSPPRGGFRSDDPNQQIVAEDIFDEYGGFLSGGNIPALLTDFNQKKVNKHSKKKSKYKKHSSNADSKYKIHHYSDSSMSSDSCDEREKKNPNHKRTRQHKCDMYKSPDYDHQHKTTRVPPDSDCDNKRRTSKSKHKKVRQHDNKRLSPSSNSDSNDNRRASSRSKHEGQHRSKRLPPSDSDSNDNRKASSRSKYERQHRSKRLPPSDSESNDNRRASSRSKHERQHRSKRLSPSDSDSSGERRMSSRSKNEKERHHSSKRLSLSDSESGEERRRLSKSENKARQHGSKRVSPSSDSDGGYEGRRTSSKRKYKGRHHTERRSRSLTSGSDNGRIISSKSRTEKDRCHVSRKHAYDESDSDHRLDRRKRRHV